MTAEDAHPPRRYAGVMLSSTFRGLEKHRAALMRAAEAQGLHAVAMEQDAALPDGTIVDASLAKVRDAAAFVGVVSRRYGQVPETDANPEHLSLSELEFREARRLGRPTLIFIMAADHPLTEADVELDPEKRRKLDAFREDVKRASHGSGLDRVYAEFHDLEGFEVAAYRSLAALCRHLDARDRVESPTHDDVPSPPQLYAEPPYIGSHAFVGRAAQLATLSDWGAAADPYPVLLFDAIGGTGKSMLTWEWTTRHAATVRGDWAGVFWYSFYERGAVMADFCRRALAYMTGRPLTAFERTKQPELSDRLLRQLQDRPWLLVLDGLERVLVAYHRDDAAHLRDEHAGYEDRIAARDPRAAIRPLDDDLVRSLAAAAPSKVLITSRLIPQVLLNAADQPIPGIRHERLPGLQPSDAEELMRSCGVRGESTAIRNYLRRHCDCHPLVTGVVAGLIAHYLPDRGDFDTWSADPAHGGRLDVGSLGLIAKRNHILHTAFAALSEPGQRLLSALALLAESADYGTILALNPHRSQEPHDEAPRADVRRSRLSWWRNRALPAWSLVPDLEEQRSLARTVTDLEQRGLLQYDQRAGRYDLHPVVRAVAAAGLVREHQESVGQQVVDHFSERLPNTYAEADGIDDLRDGLIVVRTLQRMGRTREAFDTYRAELADTMNHLESAIDSLALIRPFFSEDWGAPSQRLSPSARSWLLNDAGLALLAVNEAHQAIGPFERAVKLDLDASDWSNLGTQLRNLADCFRYQGRLAPAERCTRFALDLAELTKDGRGAQFTARLSLFAQLREMGRTAEAERVWRELDTMGRNWPSNVYIPGGAEYLHALLTFDRGSLTDAELTRAERVAEQAKNRPALRALRSLRGVWRFRQGEWSLALEEFTDAVRMAREVGISDTTSETWLAATRVHAAQLSDAHRTAGELTARREPADMPLACLWLALGDRTRATEHALHEYTSAWAEGEPYVYRSDLERATELLAELGVEPPSLPPYDPDADPERPWEPGVRAAIERLRAERAP